MSRATLYIGDKRYSTWSLRAWLALKRAGVEFDEATIPLDTPQFAAQIAPLSPSRTVPALHADGAVIWDSLSICEWAAEQAPFLWPSDAAKRATARSLAATMHAGFPHLRREAPMNLKRDGKPKALSDVARRDMERIEDLWRRFRDPSGAFLFGAWSIADAFWTPVATRVRSYAIPVADDSASYVDTLLAEPHYRAWRAGALAETYPNPLDHDV